MIIRILSLMATLAALTAVSAPAFAADDEIAAPTDEYSADAAVTPPPRCEPWMRDCRAPRPMRFVCYSRNVLGRTFEAYGNARAPRWFVQNQAVQRCRMGSFPLIRQTCRAVGCRMF